MAKTQEELIEIANHIYDAPQTLNKDVSQYQRYEEVWYRYHLYNKSGITLNFTISRIEEVFSSYRLATYRVPDGDHTKIDNPSGEKLLYGARYFFDYTNEKAEISTRFHSLESVLPRWSSIEAAKEELKSLKLETLDFTPRNGFSFFITDRGDSNLFNVKVTGVQYPEDFGFSLTGNAYLQCNPQFINDPKNRVYYLHIPDFRYGEVPQNISTRLEGVRANGGCTRLNQLFKNWESLSTQQLSTEDTIATAVKSDGYYKTE